MKKISHSLLLSLLTVSFGFDASAGSRTVGCQWNFAGGVSEAQRRIQILEAVQAEIATLRERVPGLVWSDTELAHLAEHVKFEVGTGNGPIAYRNEITRTSWYVERELISHKAFLVYDEVSRDPKWSAELARLETNDSIVIEVIEKLIRAPEVQALNFTRVVEAVEGYLLEERGPFADAQAQQWELAKKYPDGYELASAARSGRMGVAPSCCKSGCAICPYNVGFKMAEQMKFLREPRNGDEPPRVSLPEPESNEDHRRIYAIRARLKAEMPERRWE